MATTVSSYGTLSIDDLLRVNNTAVIDFGLEDCYYAVREYLAAYNALLAEQLDVFVERTTERAVGAGGPVTMKAVYTDEFGVPDVQKAAGPAQMGFPLRKWSVGLQWTYQWFANHTPQELAVQAQAAALADKIQLQTAIRQALLTPTNRTLTDRLRDDMSIFVKALANADGFPIPPAPNGFTFNPSTHTHYMGTAGSSLVASDVDNLIYNVMEHYNGGTLFLYVSFDVEATMLAGRMASPSTFPLYAPIVYTQQTIPITNVYTEGALAEAQPFNRWSGTYRDAKVFVKPWMPAGTLFAFMAGDMSGTRKPIAMRVPAAVDQKGVYTQMAGGDNGEFRMVFESMSFPLHSQVWERECGFGVANRIVGAVMTVGSPTYTMPNITPGATQYTV